MDNNDENKIIIGGSKGKDKNRIPIEAAEGVIIGDERLLSKTETKVLDLISEGEIQGLSTGKYILSGTLGNVGWTTANFQANTTAQGTSYRWLQSIYWNEIPVADTVGQFNFQQVTVNTTKGSPNGSRLSDSIVDELTITRLIGERLRGVGENFAKVYRILSKECIGTEVNVRIQSLSKTNTTKKKFGDLEADKIEYSIYYRPVFSNVPVGEYILAKKETINGKISAGYIRSTHILFNNNYSNSDTFIGWEIKLVRWTEDSTTTTIRNQSFIDSITELYGNTFVYPNSAMIASTFDAEYFANIPARAYEIQLLKVAVPDNYDPIAKTYNEASPWNGTFKTDGQGRLLKQWTDNPAWCYYDLLTNKRYGLGLYIDEDLIDKFTLYEIGKYCDTLVSDGYGGLEPRFSCNVYITSQSEAYDLINSMASVFRGITYYSAGQIYTAQDSEKHPIYQFTNANVVNGDFIYSSSAKKARHTIAVVRYNDKRNFYKPAIEYVENVDAIKKYGLREMDVLAFGCTSRGQAIRLGRWALLTEGVETETINFQAGIEVAGLIRPGDVFQIYDANRKAQRLGGRLTDIVVSPSSTNVTLDSEITIFNASTTYKLSLLTPTYYYDPAIVSDLNSNDITGFRRSHIQYLTFDTSNVSTINEKTNINIPSAIDFTNYHVSGNLIWLIEATGATVLGDIRTDEWDTYRAVNIQEVDPYTYEIQGLQYEIDKFLQVESGFSFTDSTVGADLPFASPTGMDARSRQITANSQIIDYFFGVPDITNINNFRVFAKPAAFLEGDISSGNYVIAELPKTMYSGSYFPSEDGTYNFRVYCVGTNGLLSNGYASDSVVITNINPIQDIIISSLQLDEDPFTENAAGTLSTGIYSTDSPDFDWQAGLGALTNIPSDISYRITARAPSTTNIPSTEIYYERTGYISPESQFTFEFTGNYAAVSNINPQNRGPFRAYDLVVEAMTTGGYSSAGGRFDANSIPYTDAKYTNPNGYDILYVNNPQPISRNLYTGLSTSAFYQTGYATQQWITPDGEIKIFFSISGQLVHPSGFFGDDIAGAVVYYSHEPFLPEEATNKVTNSKIINRIPYSAEENPAIVPAGLFNVFKQYLAIAPYDSFDLAITKTNTGHLSTGLNLSNVIEIRKQFSSQVYSAWVQFDVKNINGTVTLLNNWRERSYGIRHIGDTIHIDEGKEHPATEIVFDTPFASNFYGVNFTYHRFNPLTRKPYLSDNPNNSNYPTVLDIYNVPQIYEQSEERIVIPAIADMWEDVVIGNFATGRFFLGVISN